MTLDLPVWGDWPHPDSATSKAKLDKYNIALTVLEGRTLVSVKEFGAKGDGVTDDSGAFNTALVEVGITGGIVFIPAATYLIGNQLSIPTGVSLKGAGRSRSKLKASAASAITILAATQEFDIEILDLTIDGNKANVVGGNGIILEGCTDCTIKNVHVKNVFNNGILLDADGVTPCDSCSVTNNLVTDSGGHSIALSGTPGDSSVSGPQRCVIENNIIREPGSAGINVSQSRSCSVTGNTVYRSSLLLSGGYGGIRLSNGSTNCSITGNSIDGTPRGIFIVADAGAGDGSSSFNTVSGNSIRSTLQQAILCESPFNTITGNTIRDCCRDAGSLDGAIRVSNASYVGVVGNVVVDTTGLQHEFGIEVSGTSNFCSVIGNVIEGWVSLPTAIAGNSGNKADNNANDASLDRPSAAAFVLRDYIEGFVNVTGTTTIISISHNSRVGREIIMKFNGNITITNGATLKLAGAVNFNATADDTLRLVWDGLAWIEVGRSVN